MKQFIRDYLTFNKRERNGLFVLLSIIAVLIIYLNVSEQFITAPKVDFTKFESEIKQFNSSVNRLNILILIPIICLIVIGSVWVLVKNKLKQ